MDHLSWLAFVDEARRRPPQTALILGSGHGQLTSRIQADLALAFADVPGLAAPSVAGHEGAVILGSWNGRRVLVFAGRLHYYEGHPWGQVVQSVRLARELGARTLVTTNSAGGIREDLEAGTILVLRDHLDCTRPFWWRRPGPVSLAGTRLSPYSSRLRHVLLDVARAHQAVLPRGLFAQVTGPCYETLAEVRALKALGVDAVGMSTACEIQTGYELGMECVGLSCITNRAAGLGLGPLRHDEVLAVAARQRQQLAMLLEGLLSALGS